MLKKSGRLIKLICFILALAVLCSSNAVSGILLNESESAVALAAQKEEETKISESDNAKGTMSEEETVLYVLNLEDENQSPFTVHFRNGNRQVPYMDLDTIRDMLKCLFTVYGTVMPEGVKPYDVDYKTDGPKALFTRENGYTMEIDFDKDTISFVDYEMFMKSPYSITTDDLLYNPGFDEQGRPSLFQRVKEDSYDRYGKEYVLDLGAYDINLVYEDGKYYVPMQTVSDVLLNKAYLLFNTKEAFLVSMDEATNYMFGNSSKIIERYYAVSVGERSQELIDYTYNELCFALDTFYGLKDKHSIDDFDEMFMRFEVNGKSMKEMLLSTNSHDYDVALAQLMMRDMDDNHSYYLLPSVYTGEDKSILKNASKGNSVREYNNLYNLYTSERSKKYPDGVPGYEEVGNTAYITFDSFDSNYNADDLYQNPPTSIPEGTIPLLIYAHSRIMRENSPIENVVIDLSCNGGGSAETAIFVCAWFLGETCIYVDDPNTGAASCTAYRCDLNLDRKFDEKDTLEGKNLYCLMSPVSFSCGNLVPNVFSASHRVTLLGQTSGGGACVVLPMASASGSMFRTSGSEKISVIKNGAYYDVDQGVAPDLTITKIENFYDRVGLSSYINSHL